MGRSIDRVLSTIRRRNGVTDERKIEDVNVSPGSMVLDVAVHLVNKIIRKKKKGTCLVVFHRSIAPPL